MAIKKFTVAILLITAMASTFSTCKKGGLGCANAVYNFNISESVYPDKDSIKIGDTLSLNINTSTFVTDLESGNTINYNNTVNLGNVITILKFKGGQTPGAINEFNLNIKNGKKVSSIDPSSEIEVLFEESDNVYKFLLLITPKDTGRYVLTIGDAANVYRKENKCTKANFAISFQDTDQHFNWLNKWRPDLNLDANGRRHVYYFKVY